MKKLTYIIAAFLCVAALFTGCKNSLSPSEVDFTSAFATNVADGTDGLTAFTLSSVSTSAFSEPDQFITLTFNLPVDETTIENAITVSAIYDSADDETPYTATAQTYTVEKVLDEVVYLKIDLTSITGIEIFIDASVLAAENGQKMDNDGDFYQGEVNDDDIYEYDGTMPAIGCPRQPRDIVTIGFSSLSFGSFFTIEDAARTTNTFSISINDAGDQDLETILAANIAIQAYSDESWETIIPLSTVYDTTTYEYIVTFSAQEEGTPLRAYVADVQNLVTTEKYKGFVRKFELDKEETELELETFIAVSLDTTQITTWSQDFTATPTATSYDVDGDTKYELEHFTLTFDSADFITEAGYDDLGGTDYTYNGFDTDTILADNIMVALQVYNGSNWVYEYLDIESFVVLGDNSFEVIVNKSAVSTSSANLYVWVGPGLKIAAGKNESDVAISEYYFGQTTTSNLGTPTEGFYNVISDSL